jgi:hypothetical protein
MLGMGSYSAAPRPNDEPSFTPYAESMVPILVARTERQFVFHQIRIRKLVHPPFKETYRMLPAIRGSRITSEYGEE